MEEDEAEDNCDRNGAEAARAQREALEERLLKDRGLGGRRDQVPPEVEKARGRVRKAIDRALKDIAKVNLPLKRHLANAIKLGFDVAYEPGEPRCWMTAR